MLVELKAQPICLYLLYKEAIKYVYTILSALSGKVHIGTAVIARSAKASLLFGRRQGQICEQYGIRIELKRLWFCQSFYMHMRHGK